MPKTISKLVAEFRYRPMPAVIDMRGKLVQEMSSQLLTEWQISKDRVDVFNTDGNHAVFVSYQNCGLALERVSDDASLDGLLELLQKGVKQLPEQRYLRFGLRLTSFVETKKSFDKLLSNFEGQLMQNTFLSTTPQKTTVKDVALTYELIVGDDSVNLHIGPMAQEQAKTFFPGVENLPKNGIFIDVDIFRQPKLNESFKDARRFVFFARAKAVELKNYVAELVES